MGKLPMLLAMPVVVVVDLSWGEGGKVYGLVTAEVSRLGAIGVYVDLFPHFADLDRVKKVKLLGLFQRRLKRVREHIDMLFTTRDFKEVIARLRILREVKVVIVDNKLLASIRAELPFARVVPENKRELSRHGGLLTLANILDIALNVHRRRYPEKKRIEW